MGNSKTTYYGFPDKFLNFLAGNHDQRFGFRPFGEVVDCDHYILECWACRGHWTDQVYALDCEWPGRGHRSELLRVRSRNARESLALVAFPCETHGVDFHRWPKVTLQPCELGTAPQHDCRRSPHLSPEVCDSLIQDRHTSGAGLRILFCRVDCRIAYSVRPSILAVCLFFFFIFKEHTIF